MSTEAKLKIAVEVLELFLAIEADECGHNDALVRVKDFMKWAAKGEEALAAIREPVNQPALTKSFTDTELIDGIDRFWDSMKFITEGEFSKGKLRESIASLLNKLGNSCPECGSLEIGRRHADRPAPVYVETDWNECDECHHQWGHE